MQDVRMSAVLVTAIFLCVLPLSQSEQCYANNPQPYRRMGQKSSYFINANLEEEERSEWRVASQ